MGKPARREREVEGSGHRFQTRGRRTKPGYPTPSGFQIGAQSQNACLASTGPEFQLQHWKRKQATLHTPINHKKLLMASVPMQSGTHPGKPFVAHLTFGFHWLSCVLF